LSFEVSQDDNEWWGGRRARAMVMMAMKQRGDDGDGEDEDNGEDDRATLDDVRYWMQGRIKRTKLFIE
jgi:hypothetical protein